MLFTSPIFLFLFLPTVLGIYYLSPNRLKNVVLLVASLLFYSWGETILVSVMIATIVIDFFAARLIEDGRRKLGLWLSLVSNLSMLGFFKYFNFAVENYNSFLSFLGVSAESMATFPYIILPLGISFYTFQSLSYTIDVYRGEVKANRNLIDFAAFVTVFPQLIAGPIVRYIDVEEQFKSKDISLENFSEGIRRFVAGLAKKMLIANPCAQISDSVFGTSLDEVSTLWAWLGILAYSAQIFYDFSGYSDMAIGLGKMLGFNFLENFQYPYVARSVREFWQRWHISLSTWFRDYLYIPLGGNRNGNLKTYRNLLVVFFVTGLWHGASWSFVVWGLFHGAFLILERMGAGKILQRVPSWISWSYAMMVVIIGWVFFRANTISEATLYLGRMFSFSIGDPARSSFFSFYFINMQFLVVAFLAITFASSFGDKLWNGLVNKLVPIRFRGIVETVTLALLLTISASFIAADTYNPFIYFRF